LTQPLLLLLLLTALLLLQKTQKLQNNLASTKEFEAAPAWCGKQLFLCPYA
jgi:hypothetical protein